MQVSPNLSLALSANQLSFNRKLRFDNNAVFVNSPLRQPDFEVQNLSAHLRIYDGDEILNAQIGTYHVIQLGVTQLQATVALREVVDFGRDTLKINTAPSETFRTTGLILGYGRGKQFLLARRFVFDISAIAFAGVDRPFSYDINDPQSQALALAVRNTIYGKDILNGLENNVNATKYSLSVRLGVRFGFLL